MKYFIYGYYGFGNYGDELLLKTILEKISIVDPKPMFYVRCKDEISHLKSKNIEFLNIDNVFYEKGNPLKKALQFLQEGCRIINKTDYFLIGGGTLFIDKGEVNKSIILLYVLVKYAQLKKKKIILLGIASDIIANPITLFFMKKIFSIADFTAAREIYLYNYLKYFKIEKCLLTKDLVFCNDELLTLSHKTLSKNENMKTIGINFIDYFGTLEVDEKLNALFISRVNNFINKYKNNYKFVYLSMQDGIGQQDDNIYKKIDEKIDYHLFKDLKDIEKFASDIDCVITMRYHLAILSSIFMKKCFVINHELKMSSVSLDFNYPSINIYEFIEHNELDILELLKNSNPTITHETLREFYNMAKMNFNWLAEK